MACNTEAATDAQTADKQPGIDAAPVAPTAAANRLADVEGVNHTCVHNTKPVNSDFAPISFRKDCDNDRVHVYVDGDADARVAAAVVRELERFGYGIKKVKTNSVGNVVVTGTLGGN